MLRELTRLFTSAYVAWNDTVCMFITEKQCIDDVPNVNRVCSTSRLRIRARYLQVWMTILLVCIGSYSCIALSCTISRHDATAEHQVSTCR